VRLEIHLEARVLQDGDTLGEYDLANLEARIEQVWGCTLSR